MCIGERPPRWMRRAFGLCARPRSSRTILGAFAYLVHAQLCSRDEHAIIIRRGPEGYGPMCRSFTVSRNVQRLYRCARILATCDATTRPRSGPKHSAFATLYGVTGYCRLSDGRDPSYQRPCISQQRVTTPHA